MCCEQEEAQQEHFCYLSGIANGTNPVAPDCSAIQNLVLTFRADSLSPMPGAWYAYIQAEPREAPPRQRSAPSPRSIAGTVATFNAEPDRRLLQRYRTSGHASITALMEGHSPTIPKHNSKPVCLAWVLKGE